MTALHIGKKISYIRELRGLKQETLAEELGISQQSVSKIEQSEDVEEGTLAKIAKILGVTPSVIKNFNEESAIFNIQNNYEGSNNSGPNYQYNLHGLAKVVELYDALLKEKDSKIALLERLLEKVENGKATRSKGKKKVDS